MIKINIRKNGEYSELSVEGIHGSLEFGLLDESEAETVAKIFIEAATDILPQTADAIDTLHAALEEIG